MATKGNLIVLSSPSGGGKSTLVSRLLKGRSNLCYSISYTTRSPRKGEVHGKDYFFVSGEEFKRKKRLGQFIECASVHGRWYGTPRNFVQENLRKGKDVILDIDVQGGKRVKRIFPDAVLIFIAPPSLSVLEKRLRARSLDDERAIRRRLGSAKNELEQAGNYDYVVVNEKIPLALNDLSSILSAERLKVRIRK